ncbi:MAG: hypothetical protein ACRDJI_01170 [Actinomycetota bacterium]
MNGNRAVGVALVPLLGLMGCESGSDPTTQAPNRLQPSPDRSSELVLGPDGLGAVKFGADPEMVIHRLNQQFGPPDEDSGYIPSFSVFGTCPGEKVRGVRWKSLLVLFTDGATDFGRQGRRHFFEYRDQLFVTSGGSTGSLGLTTAEGIGLGSTVADLRAAYGDRLEISPHSLPGDVPRFTVEVDTGQLSGTLTGARRTDSVHAILGGFGCGE